MTDQIINIQGGSYIDVRTALTQWLKLYADYIQPDFTFELYRNGRAHHRIRVDNRIDNERFNYLVNYLKYPENIDYKINVEGFTTIKDPSIWPPEKINTEIVVFIPEDDTEHDNVYAITPKNEVFKIDFGGKLTKVPLAKTFLRPDFDAAKLPQPELIRLPKTGEIPRLAKKKSSASPNDHSPGDFPKRFRLILLIVAALFLLSYIKVNTVDVFLKINYIIGAGVALWFFMDYTMLQSNKYFLSSLFVALIIALYGYYLRKPYYADSAFTPFANGTSAPLFFLVLQRPARFLFKSLLKREPVVNKPAPSFADFIYMFVLFMSMLSIFMWLSK